jgi:hypothetical protein
MNIVPFPTTVLEALKIIVNAEYDSEDIAEVGDNLMVSRDGTKYTISEPDSESEENQDGIDLDIGCLELKPSGFLY